MGETKDLYPLIREKGEIEIAIRKVIRAGTLTLAIHGKKENAKHFLFSYSIIM